MIHRPLWKVKILLPGEIFGLTGAKVADAREVAEEEEDDIHPCFSRDGGCFLDLELPTGEHIEVFCPFINLVPDPADYGEDDGIPGEDEAPVAEAEETEFTPKDLHSLIMSHVNATPRTLSVANAKQVIAHFKVARARELTHEQALEGMAMVEKMVAAAAVE